MYARSTRRNFFVVLAGGAAGLSISFKAFGQAQPIPIKATKLSDHVTVMIGDGGNVGVVLSDDGLMMVDGGFPERAAELGRAIHEQVDANPVKVVFDTHWHFDHVGSNELVGARGAKIIAQENVKKRVSTKITVEALNRTFEPLKPQGMPTQEFAKGGKMTFGTEKIEYVHIPTAHTDGDAYVFFPDSNVLHAGDLFFNGNLPVIDYTTGGWVGGMAHAAELMSKVCDGKTRVIPGHGPLGSREDLKVTAGMLSTLTQRLEKLIKEGKSADEAVAAAPTKEFDEKYGNGTLKPAAWTRVAYTSIQRHSQKA